MHDRWDAGQVGCNHTGYVEYRIGGMQDKWNAREEIPMQGQVEYGWDEGQVGYRTGGMQDRWDA